MPKIFKDFINGMVFGVTQIVPGVSGGTIAIILGFYDELIESINQFRKEPRKCLKFIIPIGLGTVVGVIVFSTIISYLLNYFSFPTMSFFIGLVIGIIPLIYQKVKEPGKSLSLDAILLIAIPILILVVISGLTPVAVTDPAEIIRDMSIPYMIFIFIVGFIGAAAMIIPGLSGSFIMLLLGVYTLITFSFSSVTDWLTDPTNISLFIDICKVLAPFGLGVVIGVLCTARLVENLLKNYAKIIYPIILGLLVGSVYSLFNRPEVYHSGISVPIVAVGIIMLLLGCVVSYSIGKKRL